MARGETIWINGNLKPEKECQVSLFSHGLHYGTGGFEGIRVYADSENKNCFVFHLKKHLERFLMTAKIMGLQLPYSVDELSEACKKVVKENHFKACYLRPLFFIGEGPLGINIGETPPIIVAIMTWEWGKYLGEEGAKNGIRLKISSYARPQVNSIMTKGKITGQYVTGVLAKREAVSLGFDEALFLDPEGFIAEGTGENIFIVKDQKVKTPPLTSVLEGITRNSIIQVLKNLDIEITEQRFSRDELYGADEVFLTGTAAEITPVREIDQRAIGKGKAGLLTQKLQALFQDIVQGKGPQYTQAWLEPIE